MELLYKPNAEASLDRFESWWKCENEAPLVDIRVPQPYDPPRKSYPSQRGAWLDFGGRLERFEEDCRHTDFVADSFPAFNPNLGPDLLSTLWGTQIQFAPDTSWVSPIARSCEEVLDLRADFGSPFWQEALRFTRMSLERGQGKWLTCFHDLHPNADIPSALIGPETLCLEFADDLNAARKAIESVTPDCVRAYETLHGMIAETGQPSLTWLPAPHRGRMYVPQCDFSAMISTDMFVEAVLPSIRAELEATDRGIYHLDGPDALRHLDVLLEIPEIHGIQWVYGAGNGPALRWAHVYQRIQKAGKCMQILAETPEDALALHRILGPEGVLYAMGFGLPKEETLDLLEALGSPA
ncbi:MAG TPA: hypothetical protein VGE01_05655 [Fimbriimonas sp.]